MAITKKEARRLTEEIRETAGRLNLLVREAYEKGVHNALKYGSWKDYIDTEFPELPKEWRYHWRSYGDVNDALRGSDGENFSPVSSTETKRIVPHLELVKERIEEAGPGTTPAERLEIAKSVVDEQKAHKEEPTESIAQDFQTASCRIQPPSEVIMRIDHYLSRILDDHYYVLSSNDKAKLRRILNKSIRTLEEMRNGLSA